MAWLAYELSSLFKLMAVLSWFSTERPFSLIIFSSRRSIILQGVEGEIHFVTTCKKIFDLIGWTVLRFYECWLQSDVTANSSCGLPTEGHRRRLLWRRFWETDREKHAVPANKRVTWKDAVRFAFSHNIQRPVSANIRDKALESKISKHKRQVFLSFFLQRMGISNAHGK